MTNVISSYSALKLIHNGKSKQHLSQAYIYDTIKKMISEQFIQILDVLYPPGSEGWTKPVEHLDL